MLEVKPVKQSSILNRFHMNPARQKVKRSKKQTELGMPRTTNHDENLESGTLILDLHSPEFQEARERRRRRVKNYESDKGSSCSRCCSFLSISCSYLANLSFIFSCV